MILRRGGWDGDFFDAFWGGFRYDGDMSDSEVSKEVVPEKRRGSFSFFAGLALLVVVAGAVWWFVMVRWLAKGLISNMARRTLRF